MSIAFHILVIVCLRLIKILILPYIVYTYSTPPPLLGFVWSLVIIFKIHLPPPHKMGLIDGFEARK